MKYIDFLPEWTPCDGVLMALPDKTTDWAYILDEVRDQYKNIVKELTSCDIHVVMLCKNMQEAQNIFCDVKPEKLTLIKLDYNDTWTRDYGPITIAKDDNLRALHFGFNGWGLKFAADKDNLVNRNLEDKSVFTKGIFRNRSGFILEGGSIDTDGMGTILTTSKCLCSPNRNGGLSKSEADTNLRRFLGADHILFLDYGHLEGDDTDSHIDTLARMAPDNTILFTGCRDMDDPQFEDLLKMRAQLTMFKNPEGLPYNLIELPLPSPIYDEEGQRLPATYANYLVINGFIFMPTYDQPENDALAVNTVKIAFPDYEVIGIDCRTLIKQHGSLHCATMQLPCGLFNPVIFNK